MTVECIICGTKNDVPDHPDPEATYRCLSCEETLDLEFGEREGELGVGEADAQGSRGLNVRDDRFTKAMLSKGPPFSIKRLLGAALFGALTTAYTTKACESTLPRILSITQRVNSTSTTAQYEQFVLTLLILGFSALLGSGAAAFLSRRKMILAGILANLPYSLLHSRSLVAAILDRDYRQVSNLSFHLFSFLPLLFLLVASILGAMAARRLYSPELDLDLRTGRVTIFGVRWVHYSWIFPFVVCPCISSFVMALYAGILILLTHWYVTIHPSLWFSQSWIPNATLNPLVVLIACWMTVTGLKKFLAVMIHGQSTLRSFGRFWRAIWYGVFQPTIGLAIASTGASMTYSTYSLLEPTPRDWKLGVGFIIGFFAVWLLVSGWSWINERMSVRH